MNVEPAKSLPLPSSISQSRHHPREVYSLALNSMRPTRQVRKAPRVPSIISRSRLRTRKLRDPRRKHNIFRLIRIPEIQPILPQLPQPLDLHVNEGHTFLKPPKPDFNLKQHPPHLYSSRIRSQDDAVPFFMHGNGVKIELEIPLPLDSINRAGYAQVLGIPVEWAFDTDLGSCSWGEKMTKLLDVECIMTEVWLFISCWSGKELG